MIETGQVVRLMVDGLTDKEIAGRLQTSVSNVKYHLNKEYRRHGWYGVTSRVKLAVFEVRKEKGDEVK